MSRVLELVFNTEMGTTKTLRVIDAKDPLAGAEVTAVMDSIIAKNIFSGAGGGLVGKIKAQIVTTTSADVSLT